MTFFQKLLGALWPPYKSAVFVREEQLLLDAIVAALPVQLSIIKQLNTGRRLYGISDWDRYPGFQFVSIGYTPEEGPPRKERGLNKKISGLTIYSKRTKREEHLELLVNNGLICGLSILPYTSPLADFDLQRVTSDHCIAVDFTFPPDPVEGFYNTLPAEIRAQLVLEDIEQIELNTRTYYTILDMGNGNCLAADKKHQVYSLVHDARPMAKGMKIALPDMMRIITQNQFDTDGHLEDRYSKSR